MLGTNDDEILKDPSGLRESFQRDFPMMNQVVFGEYLHQYVKADEQIASVKDS